MHLLVITSIVSGTPQNTSIAASSSITLSIRPITLPIIKTILKAIRVKAKTKAIREVSPPRRALIIIR